MFISVAIGLKTALGVKTSNILCHYVPHAFLSQIPAIFSSQLFSKIILFLILTTLHKHAPTVY